MDNWIKRFKNATPINENQKVLIPGEPEFAAEKERLQNGIPLHTSVAADLAALASEFKIDFLECLHNALINRIYFIFLQKM